MCFGFWAGIGIRYLLIQQLSIDLFIYGLIGSFASYCLYLLLANNMEKYD